MSNAKKTAKVLPDLSQMHDLMQALIQENAALKAAKPAAKQKSITLGEYEGHPTVTIDIPGKRKFYIGVSKLRQIFDNDTAIKALIKSVPVK